MSYELKPGERYAGFWIRFLASVVDSILVSIVIGPVVNTIYHRKDATADLIAAAGSGDIAEMFLALSDTMTPSSVGEGLLNVGLPALAVILFWIYRSATPGKMVTKTRLVDATTGAAPGTKQCIVRYLGYFVSMAGLFVGFLWVAIDKRKQAWHDKLANTVVIREAPNA